VSALLPNVVAFGRLLRRAGFGTAPDETREFARALELLHFGSRTEALAAGRAIFVRNRDQRALFDRAFALFWRRLVRPDGDEPVLPRIRQTEHPAPTFPAPAPPTDLFAEDTAPPMRELTLAGERERLEHADFALLTEAELRDAARMIAALTPRLPTRPSRRWIPSRRAGLRPARARMLRRALATFGEPLAWSWLAHPRRARPIVLVADISGSMERYSRLMLRFAHALKSSGARVETFVFGTRLTRITRELALRDPDAALRRVGHTVIDWNGGTKIGESLHELNQRWVRRTIRSGAIVLIASDGWERGDPALLATEMARLRRSCYRLYWLDPLANQPGFVPEVAGLRAALPHVDALLPCATVASLEALAARLEGLGTGNWEVGTGREPRHLPTSQFPLPSSV
jgi:uncharacterized protein with von Willebrand factor type A (vWA) domain